MEAALATLTREDGVHRKFARALDRFRRAETELGHAMDDLIDGITALREIGVVADVEMGRATQAAWIEHKVARRPPE